MPRPTKRRRLSKTAIAIDHSRNTWTPQMAAAWAGMPLRTLYRLLRAGTVPAIPIGDSVSQDWAPSRTGTRERACARYMIPRTAFIRWFEGIGAPAPNIDTRNPPLTAA